MIKKINLLLFSIVLIVILILVYFFVFNKIASKYSAQQEAKKPEVNLEKFEFQKVKILTEDGVEIIGNYYKAQNSKFAGILLHMMPSTKESYKNLAELLQKSGYSVLAIDFRGHGESINSIKGTLDYRTFTDSDHQSYINDLKAASDFLKKEGFPIENQFLVGASIGANIALQFLSQNPEIKATILLSPGKDYRGVKIENFLKKEQENKLMIIIGEKDMQSIESLNVFKSITPSSTIITLDTDAHGTDILEKFPDLYNSIIVFLKERLI